jgi:hypothetical protein
VPLLAQVAEILVRDAVVAAACTQEKGGIVVLTHLATAVKEHSGAAMLLDVRVAAAAFGLASAARDAGDVFVAHTAERG